MIKFMNKKPEHKAGGMMLSDTYLRATTAPKHSPIIHAAPSIVAATDSTDSADFDGTTLVLRDPEVVQKVAAFLSNGSDTKPEAAMLRDHVASKDQELQRLLSLLQQSEEKQLDMAKLLHIANKKQLELTEEMHQSIQRQQEMAQQLQASVHAQQDLANQLLVANQQKQEMANPAELQSLQQQVRTLESKLKEKENNILQLATTGAHSSKISGDPLPTFPKNKNHVTTPVHLPSLPRKQSAPVVDLDKIREQIRKEVKLELATAAAAANTIQAPHATSTDSPSVVAPVTTPLQPVASQTKPFVESKKPEEESKKPIKPRDYKMPPPSTKSDFSVKERLRAKELEKAAAASIKQEEEPTIQSKEPSEPKIIGEAKTLTAPEILHPWMKKVAASHDGQPKMSEMLKKPVADEMIEEANKPEILKKPEMFEKPEEIIPAAVVPDITAETEIASKKEEDTAKPEFIKKPEIASKKEEDTANKPEFIKKPEIAVKKEDTVNEPEITTKYTTKNPAVTANRAEIPKNPLTTKKPEMSKKPEITKKTETRSAPQNGGFVFDANLLNTGLAATGKKDGKMKSLDMLQAVMSAKKSIKTPKPTAMVAEDHQSAQIMSNTSE